MNELLHGLDFDPDIPPQLRRLQARQRKENSILYRAAALLRHRKAKGTKITNLSHANASYSSRDASFTALPEDLGVRKFDGDFARVVAADVSAAGDSDEVPVTDHHIDLSGWFLDLVVNRMHGLKFYQQRLVITPHLMAMGSFERVGHHIPPLQRVWDDVILLHEIKKFKDLDQEPHSHGAESIAHDEQGLIAIYTDKHGRNSGRVYCLQVVGYIKHQDNVSVRTMGGVVGHGHGLGHIPTNTGGAGEGMLEVTVVNCRNLPKTDLVGSCDPYVVLRSAGYEFKTKPVMNTLQPDFNQTFRVPIKRLARPDKITMTVKDFNPGLSVMGVSLGRTEADQEVGVCEIPAEKIVALEQTWQQADGGLLLALPLKMVTGKPGTRRSDFPSAPASSASPAMIEVRIRILGTIKATDSGADTDVGQGQAPMAGNKGLARDAARETDLETLDTEALPLHAVDVVQLIETVEALVVAATNRERPSKLIERTRHMARMLFRSLPFQMCVALLILGNFFANAYEAQMNGRLVTDDGLPSHTAKVLKTADLFFTIIFTVELLINMYAHLFWAFVRDGWCMFDFFVVTVSLISTFNDNGDGAVMSVFRLLRAFRIIRIFGRLRSIRSIINALAASLIPVMNAFFIMAVVCALYSIIGVTFYDKSAPEDFGNLSRALITMFRIAAGETWIEHQPVLRDDGTVDWATAGFIISYVLVINWTLLQVSVAVLLDNFVSETAREKAHQRSLQIEETRAKDNMGNPLDPLLKIIANEYVDEQDLDQCLRRLFFLLVELAAVGPGNEEDDWEGGKASQDEAGHGQAPSDLVLTKIGLCKGLRELHVDPPIHITSSDVHLFMSALEPGPPYMGAGGNIRRTPSGNGLVQASLPQEEATALRVDDFVRVMRRQVQEYVRRKLQRSVSECTNQEDFSQLASLKILVADMDAMRADLNGLGRVVRDIQASVESMREEGSSLNVLHVGGGREGPRDRAVVVGGDKEMDQIAQTLYRLAKQVEGMRESRDQKGVEQSPGTAVGQQVCAENSAGNGSGLDAVVSRQGKPHDTAVNDSNHGDSNGGSRIVPGQTESAPLENALKSKAHDTKERKPLHFSTHPHDRLALFPTPRVLLGVHAGDEEESSMLMSEVPHENKDHHARGSGNGIENRRQSTTPPTNTNPDVFEVTALRAAPNGPKFRSLQKKMERPAEQSLVPSAAGNKQPLSFFGGALSLSGQLGAPLGQLFSDVKQGSDLMMSQIGDTPVTAAPTRAHLSNALQSAAHKTPAAYGGPHGLHYRTEQGGPQTNASEKKRQTSQPQQRHGASKDDNTDTDFDAASVTMYDV